MSTTIPDISVDDTAWLDLNTASGITVGDAMIITNKSVTWCRLFEGTTPPAVSSKDGQLITNLDKNYATANVPVGSLKVWAISTQKDRTVSLSVQPV